MGSLLKLKSHLPVKDPSYKQVFQRTIVRPGMFILSCKMANIYFKFNNSKSKHHFFFYSFMSFLYFRK